MRPLSSKTVRDGARVRAISSSHRLFAFAISPAAAWASSDQLYRVKAPVRGTTKVALR